MKRTALWRLLTVLTILSLVIGSVQILLASPASDKGSKPRYSLVKDAEGNQITKTAQTTATGDTVRVFVRLSDSPLAAYKGGVSNIPAPSLTAAKKLDLASPAAKAYLSYLEGKQTAFKTQLAKVVPSATVWGSTRLTSNGLALVVPKKDVAALGKLPGVTRVIPEKLIPVDMDTAPAVYGASVIWNALGGQSNSGRGVKIAIVDTGADPDAPMYNDAGFTAPPGYPRPMPRRMVLYSRRWMRAATAHSSAASPAAPSCRPTTAAMPPQ
jgi:minor extracellular serine protease Vpr